MEPAFISAFFKFDANSSAVPWAPVADVMKHVNAALEKRPYLLGQTFSGADVLAGSAFMLFHDSPLQLKSAALTAYVERLNARPAYRKAETLDGTV